MEFLDQRLSGPKREWHVPTKGLLRVLLLMLLMLYSMGCQSTLSIPEEAVLEKVEKTYNVTPGGRLTLLSEFGAVEIQTAEQDEVAIVVTKASKYRLLKAAEKMIADFELGFEHEGSDVRIEGAFKRGRKHWQKKLSRLNVHFLVRVPHRYNIDVETSGGSVSVADLEGDVRAKTSGGTLHFGNITGSVSGRTSGGSIELASCDSAVELKTSGGHIKAVDVGGDVQAETSGGNLHFSAIAGAIHGKTSGGNIQVEHCEGEADVHTSGGNIKLQRVNGSVKARTSGGSIHAAMFVQPQSECNLRTSGGNITVALIPDIAVAVEAETSGGRVATDFAVESTVQGKVPKNKVKGNINGGGPLLKLRTSGGNIHLQRTTD